MEKGADLPGPGPGFGEDTGGGCRSEERPEKSGKDTADPSGEEFGDLTRGSLGNLLALN